MKYEKQNNKIMCQMNQSQFRYRSSL